MSKQEEIREWIEENHRLTTTKVILDYLHSQGVVIKVKGKEPNAICQTNDWDDSLPYTEYVEVEPLIEQFPDESCSELVDGL